MKSGFVLIVFTIQNIEKNKIIDIIITSKQLERIGELRNKIHKDLTIMDIIDFALNSLEENINNGRYL